jgi:hypothetical protein
MNKKKEPEVRELTAREAAMVAGGPLPVAGLVLNLAARFVTSQLARHFIRNAGLAVSSYGAAEYFSSR